MTRSQGVIMTIMALLAGMTATGSDAAKEKDKTALIFCRPGPDLDFQILTEKNGEVSIFIRSQQVGKTLHGTELKPGQCAAFEQALAGEQTFVQSFKKRSVLFKCGTGQGNIYRCAPAGDDALYESLRYFRDDGIVQFQVLADKKKVGVWQITRWDGVKPLR